MCRDVSHMHVGISSGAYRKGSQPPKEVGKEDGSTGPSLGQWSIGMQPAKLDSLSGWMPCVFKHNSSEEERWDRRKAKSEVPL